ncbi:LytTR family DNA-binding domain-containing protein [Thiohalocapsa sp. ML1]|jgi:two-component system, LytTR family, response regulator AlgR|uniref:LytR/AlgR family response regulator transcription factor n=1 Tax=Thiohalocapsa sp. ML1 TaxID=1431688 RepID=UPI0007321324|nr:LytTR family DNA-binding domain-containing protein [Thiohalocapsa sp. ML1]
MKILLVDDEALARERLRRLIEELGDGYEVVGEAATGEAAIAAMLESDADLVLLDQKMPGMSGLDAAAALAQLDPPPAVVLVTAYPEYALEAFEHDVADYLVKPVRRERLQAALERVPRMTRPQHAYAERQEHGGRRRHLSAHYRGGVQTVLVEEVLYLLAEQKYVTVRHAGGRMLIDESLKSLEEEYPDRFVRIHRNALVAIEQLVGLEKAADGASLAVLAGCEERLPVSRRHLPEIRRFLRHG